MHESENIGYLPFFDWEDLLYAQMYQLDLATDINFNQNVVEIANIEESEYMLETPLEENTNYFWRLRGMNTCGESAYSDTFTFKTGGEICIEDYAIGTPIQIPALGTPIISSTINHLGSGPVTAVSISHIDITHSYISDLLIKLVSPSGTEVILLDGICGGSDNMYLGIEDNTLGSFNCPPTDSLVYSPIELLSSFINEEANGDWTLSIQDQYNYDGGTFNGWSLNICTAQSFNCESMLEISDNPITDGIYEAYQDILSTGMIPSNGNVNFKAGQSVLLDGGFEIEVGSVFELSIGDCEN